MQNRPDRSDVNSQNNHQVVLVSSHDKNMVGFLFFFFYYIIFCVDNTIPDITVRCSPSIKPQITSDPKELIEQENQKNHSVGDGELLRSVGWGLVNMD